MIPEIHFAALHLMPCVALFVLIFLLYIRYEWMRSKVVRALVGTHTKSLVNYFSLWKRCLKGICILGALSMLFIALLRPCWGKTEEIATQEGRDLLIAIDVSRSMLAQDLKPNRLAFAKNKIRQLVHALKSERIGLLIFAGNAVIQCPLTTDYKAFFMFLDSLDAQTISSGTTALDQALKKALTVFAKSDFKKTKLVVLLTDGEDFSSNLSGIKEQVIKEGLTVFTIGIGTVQGAPIPILDERGNQKEYEKDMSGAIVMSRLNEGILKALAHESGGQYLLATEDNRDIATVIKSVEQFERETFDDRTVVQWHEKFMYFVGIGFVLLLCEWLL